LSFKYGGLYNVNHNIYKIKINNLHIGLYIRKENAEMGIWGSTIKRKARK